jgi:tetratricopeptide (TPR) repeat protein
MGVVYARDLDWAGSERHFQQAIALNPSLSQVYTSYSFFTLRPLHKFEDAERLLNGALQTDPLSLDVWREIAEVISQSADTMRRSICCSACELWIRSCWTRRSSCPRPRVSRAVEEALALYDSLRQKDHRSTVRTRISSGAAERTQRNWRLRMRSTRIARRLSTPHSEIAIAHSKRWIARLSANRSVSRYS